MGLGPSWSGSSYDKVKIREVPVPNPFNPDPRNFLIERIEQCGKYIIVQVMYPNCKNYEGRKILLFNWMTLEQITNLEVLDPHFSSEKPELSPVARFVPTKEGWDMAVLLAQITEYNNSGGDDCK